MKMHLAWIRVTAAATTTIATFGGQLAAGQGQYGPYAPASTVNPYTSVAPYGVQPTPPAPTTTYYPSTVYPTTPNTVQAPTTATPTTTTATAGGRYTPAQQPVYRTAQQPVATQPQVTAQQPTYRTAQQPSYVPVTQQPYSPAVQATQPPTQPPAAQIQAPQYQAPQYQSGPYHASQYQATPSQASQYETPRYQQPPSYPIYTAMADTSHAGHAPSSTPVVPPQTAEPLPTPDPAIRGDAMPSGYNAGMNNPTTEGLDGYYASDPGYNTGNCNTGNGGYNACAAEPCVEECAGGGGHWFGGVYGLYMTRTQGPYRNYTAGVDTSVSGTPYYPNPNTIENFSDCDYLVPHWRGGVEARLGCTFSIGDSCSYSGCGVGDACGSDACGCNPCCQPCCQQTFAWEVAWWGLDGEVQEQFVDGPVVGDFRYYGLVNYAGLQYDDGSGAQPVNDYYNYQIPITGLGAETVLAQRVRTNFKAQNLELNFLRLPMFTGGCGYDCCAPAFSITGLCGVRYFRFDDDLEFGTEWADGGQTTFDGWGNGTNELFHDIQMENQLVGFQLGANMNYAIASRWNAFWDTNFGIYNNHINQYQRMYNPLVGPATFVQGGENATVNSSKNDVAFLGEMRLGGGYQFTPRWRGILAYRAIAVSGVALAPDQIKPEYGNWANTALINADGSLIVHGIQAGVECCY